MDRPSTSNSELQNAGARPKIENPVAPLEIENPVAAPEIENAVAAPEIENPVAPPEFENPGAAPEIGNVEAAAAPEIENPGAPPEIENVDAGAAPEIENPVAATEIENPGAAPEMENVEAGAAPENENPGAAPEMENVEAGAAPENENPGAAPEIEVSGMHLDVYNAAKTGHIEVLEENRERLSVILTATSNTVLHIYIACAFPDDRAMTNKVAQILDFCPELLKLQNKRDETALHIAARHGHHKIVQYLIDAVKVDQEANYLSLFLQATNKDGDTALHEAVRFNHVDVVTILTEEDRTISYSANAAGETPLYMAAERKHPRLVSQILETCNDVAFQGPKGRTALHAAVSYNDTDMTTELLNHYTGERALTKKVDEEGMTPLHLAALFGHSSIVEQLLVSDKSAAYVHDKDDEKTALHIAASKGYVGVFKQIIDHCPDCCELLDKRDRSILHYAIEKNQLHILDFIRQDRWLGNVLLNGKDADLNTPLQQLLAVSVHETHKPSGECLSIMKSSSRFIRDARVDLMAFNKRNQNAFDIVTTDNVSLWEKDLRRKLEVHGGRPGHRLVKQDKAEQETEIKGAIKETSTDARMQQQKQVHLIVSTLIATVTFSAGMSVLGGFETQEGPDQGLAVLRKDFAFKIFNGFNTISLVLSASSVWLNFIGAGGLGPEILYRLRYLTFNALVSMLLAFIVGLWTVFRDTSILGMSLILSVCLVLGTLTCTKRNTQRFIHRCIPWCPGFLVDLLLVPYSD